MWEISGVELTMTEKKNKTTQEADNILEVSHLKKYFPIKGGMFGRQVGAVKAVDDVSFTLKRGTTMGLVGESGCGKSTTGRTILRLIEKTDGQVLFNGKDVYGLSNKEMRDMRTKMQIIFQDPYSSLSPRLPVGEIIGEAVKEHNLVPKNEYQDYITKIMNDCGLQSYHKDRYPHEFSGGQRQRICIARALALNPEFVVCDEPVSALDVSVQAQIINLLKTLQEERNLTYLFISHDLSVVEHISDSIGVMYLGGLVETGATEDIFANPLHPYTQALVLCDSDAGSGSEAEPYHPGRKHPVPGQSAEGLQVPHPLQPLHGVLQDGRAKGKGHGERTCCKVPSVRLSIAASFL